MKDRIIKDKHFTPINKGDTVLQAFTDMPYVVVGFKLNNIVVVENTEENLCSDVRASELIVV